MIICDHGTIKVKGTAVELTADVITIQEALLRTFDNKTENLRALNNRLVKNIIYSFTRSADKLGYSTEITVDELIDLENTWREVNEK